ncbi:hypothetical protein K388_05016 [Streptomyces sp. KhCrAH-43]|nr:hypothetical protein K388_05016 [Streptomyces sp. KhCrAH-43]
MTALRRAAVDGLHHASRLVTQFGWAPASPDGPSLHVMAHLRAAARCSAARHHMRAEDVRALMGYLLEASVDSGLWPWEDEPGRSAADVSHALAVAAATAASPTPDAL